MRKFKVATAERKISVVATPIGNLQELSPRALAVLAASDLVLCEDTRVTGRLLAAFGLKKPLLSIGSVDESKSVAKIGQRLDGAIKVALLSDAGYPGLSDPGASIIQEAYERGIAVEVINGPSAVMHALVVSGFWLNEFFYAGFLPARTKDRKEKLVKLASLNCVVVLFEAPHRIEASLSDIAELMPDRAVAVCRELTKLHETIYLGTAKELVGEVTQKGEMVIVLGKVADPSTDGTLVDGRAGDLTSATARVAALVKGGMRVKEACQLIAKQNNLKSKDLYGEYLKIK